MLMEGETRDYIENALRQTFDVPEGVDLLGDIVSVEERCVSIGLQPYLERKSVYEPSLEAFPAPNFVDFNITNRCNMNCRHCYMGGPGSLDFPTGRALKVIRSLGRMGTLKVALAGGEPFMHPHWEILLNAIVSSGMMAMINSNGTLIDEELVSRLRELYDPRDLILAISIDGDNTVTNRLQRPWADPMSDEDSFTKAMHGIGLLTESGFVTCVNMTVTSMNLQCVIPLYRQLQERLRDSWSRFKVLNLIKFGAAGSGFKNLAELEIAYADWRKFLLELTQLKRAGDLNKLKVEPTCPWELLVPLHGICLPDDIMRTWHYVSPLENDIYRQRRNIGCNAGISHICINPDGTVSACGLYSQHEGFHVGNVIEQDIADIWVSSERLSSLRTISLDSLGGRCNSCKFANLCGGGCRGAALVLTGNLLGPDVRCPIARSRSKMAAS